MRSVIPDFDVIVVGSGPAGVSAAFPLVEAGLRVLMVDGGKQPGVPPPEADFLSARSTDNEQWKWMVGEDYHALKNRGAVSPKLRVPSHAYVFDGFGRSNKIEGKDFIALGSLATGGLSNTWGCGVARLSSKELAEFPFPESNIEQSYETVARRIGISGASGDDLSGYFGLDAWSQPAIQMDSLHLRVLERYSTCRSDLASLGFRMGRSRVAALSQDFGGRKACELSGNCLWGCHRQSLYSAAYELPSLTKHENFHFRSGFVVDRIGGGSGFVSVEGHLGLDNSTLTAKKVLLAAGTLASTRLALHALKLDTPVRLQSSPMAAFLLWLPRMLGVPRTSSFGLGQLSFALELTADISAFGSTFSTLGIPVAEFVRHLPLSKRYGIDLLRHLLSSCLVGNMFLPGHLSTAKVSLNTEEELIITGGYSSSVPGLMSDAENLLRKSFWRLGALLLPMSFTQGRPGGDIHYSGTLPMRIAPVIGETNTLGEPAGLAGVYVVDGACLPKLHEKSHTLTIMANADRIGRALAIEMKES